MSEGPMSHIYLIGFLESGNFTLGKHLSDQIQRPFFDTDSHMVENVGKDLNTYLSEHGEDAYYEKQHTALRHASNLHSPTVIVVGDEVPLRQQDWQLMHETGKTFYIKRTAERLYWRLRHDPNRASLQHTANQTRKERIEAMLAERQEAYTQASHVLEVTHEEVETISNQIATFL